MRRRRRRTNANAQATNMLDDVADANMETRTETNAQTKVVAESKVKRDSIGHSKADEQHQDDLPHENQLPSADGFSLDAKPGVEGRGKEWLRSDARRLRVEFRRKARLLQEDNDLARLPKRGSRSGRGRGQRRAHGRGGNIGEDSS